MITPPEVPEYMQPLVRVRSVFPQRACDIVRSRRAESVPHLIRSIEWATQHPDVALDESCDYLLYNYATYLLAEFRETAAYAPIVDMLRSPSAFDLLGDTTTEVFCSVLSSVCGGDYLPLKNLAKDASVGSFIRGSVVKAFAVEFFLGRLDRAGMVQVFQELFATMPREWGNNWDCLLRLCVEFRLAELMPDMERAVEEELCDSIYDWEEEVQKEITQPFDPEGDELREKYPTEVRVEDVMGWWECFSFTSDRIALMKATSSGQGKVLSGQNSFSLGGQKPICRDAPKTGRNDPCPCGSGKKYKKCCGVNAD
jgi:hypothetical protein